MTTCNFEQIVDALVSIGWTRIQVEYSLSKTTSDVTEWVEENSRSEYSEHCGVWLFKDSADAYWFTLRWV